MKFVKKLTKNQLQKFMDMYNNASPEKKKRINKYFDKLVEELE